MINHLKKSYSPPRADEIGGEVKQQARYYKSQPFTNTDFESPAALESYVEDILNPGGGAPWKYHTYNDPFKVQNVSDWAWGWSTRQMIELSRKGWHEVSRHIGPASIASANAVYMKHEGLTFDMGHTGAAVDVASFLSGEPECMIEFRDAPAAKPSIEIVLDAFASGSEEAGLIFQRGGAVMSAVLTLETLGYAVSVKFGRQVNLSGGPHSGETIRFGVWLHRPGWALDPARFSVWACHPGWMRGVYYVATGLCLGNYSAGQRGEYAQTKPGVYYVPGLLKNSHPWKDEQAACEQIVKEIIEGVTSKQAA